MAWPKSADVERPVELLRRSLSRGRLGHAYLFAGDSPEVLESIAMELASTVNCTGRGEDTVVPEESCGTCASCRRIAEGVHPEVHWVRAESKLRVIRVEQVRQLMNAMQLKSSGARWKVGILVGADLLNAQAANAFLKVLEEPPRRTLFILLTTQPGRVLDTILSRCLRLNFPGEDHPDAAQLAWLEQFVSAVRGDGTGLLGRYRLLDVLLQRLADARRESEAAIEERSPSQRYDDVDPSLAEQWENEARAAVEAEFRRRRTQALRLLQVWLRDVWLTTLDQPRELLMLPQLAEATADVARRLQPERAEANLGVIEQTQSILHTNVQEAVALEVALLRLHL